MSEAEVPDSRTYRHLPCGAETTIGGQPFEVMSNPLSDMASTFCATCEEQFPLDQYEWSDTGEKVTDYYARHSANATDLQRFLCSRKCMMLLAVFGLALGCSCGYFLLGRKILVAAFCGGLGGVVGLAVYISGLCGPITRKVCGVSDTRTLK